jgi:hypothetical protein
MASMIAFGEYDLVLGSRILGAGARRGGMPLYKYIANRFLTFVQNILFDRKISEYHTGYRAFTREVLSALPLPENSDDFIFDGEVLAQAIFLEYRIGEISCPARYFPEASSLNFARSLKYGLQVLLVSLKFWLQKHGLGRFKLFNPPRRRLTDNYYDAAEGSPPQETCP